MNSINIYIYLFISLFLLSCYGTRKLQTDEFLLYEQKIKGNKEIKKYELKKHLAQHPNKTILFTKLPYLLGIYRLGKGHYNPQKAEDKFNSVAEKYNRKIKKHEGDSIKVNKLKIKRSDALAKKKKKITEGNFFMRLGEPPSLYDSLKAKATKTQLQNYLTSKGYFHSNVEQKIKKKKKKIYSYYHIFEGKPFIINDINVFSLDSNILNIIRSSQATSFLQKNDKYEQDNLTNERNRIEGILKNNGYYDFHKRYVLFKIDTSNRLNETLNAAITIEIRKPTEKKGYTQYRVDSLEMTFDLDNNSQEYQSIHQNGRLYKFHQINYPTKILEQRILIKPDSLYSLYNTLQTHKSLLFLNNYKFININYDSVDGKFVAFISASRLQKYQNSMEVGLSYAYRFPGPFFNWSLTTRNIFGGLENLQFSIRGSYEAGVTTNTEIDNNKVYSNLELGGSVSLIFPQFIAFFSKQQQIKFGILNPKTLFSTGFDFTNRPEYKRQSWNSALTYSWNSKPTDVWSNTKKRDIFYNAYPFKLELINSRDLSDHFNDFLDSLYDKGNTLRNSFEPSLITSIGFNINFNYLDKYPNSSAWIVGFENGGFLSDWISSEGTFGGYRRYKYIRALSDYRVTKSLGGKQSIATRINLGCAVAFNKDKVLPYEKHFFAGGSNSVRAWLPKRLGPGSVAPPKNDKPQESGLFDYSIERPGELLLETSIEYRFNVISFLESALFVDAGNIWYVRKNEEIKGAEFDIRRFYKEIAVGIGTGIRLNFSVLVVRLDYGIKIHDPARPEGERFIGNIFKLETGQGVFSFAIGYPF